MRWPSAGGIAARSAGTACLSCNNARVSTPPPIPPAGSPAPAAVPAKRRTPWLPILLGIGVPCAGCSLLFVCFLGAAFAPGTELPVTDADRAVLLDAEDLAEWSDFDVAVGTESVKKTKDLFGTHELAYEFTSDEGVFVNTTVTYDKTESDARSTFSVTKMGLGVGMALEKSEGMTREERNELFAWGDDSVTYLLQMNGAPVGNVIVARKGKRTYFVIFAGVYFDDEGQLEELLSPQLTALETWNP